MELLEFLASLGEVLEFLFGTMRFVFGFAIQPICWLITSPILLLVIGFSDKWTHAIAVTVICLVFACLSSLLPKKFRDDMLEMSWWW